MTVPAQILDRASPAPAAFVVPPAKWGASSALRSFIAAVCLPTLLAAFYYGVIASDVYVAEARFAIRSASTTGAGGLLDTFVGASNGGSSTAQDAEIVRDYILSRDMLEKLDARINLRAHYTADDHDWVARLPADASEEDYVEYFRDMTTIRIDESSHITTIETSAFDAETAREIATNILELSEQLVNEMSATVADDTLKFARRELADSEDRVRASTMALTKYRTLSQSVDPGQESSAVLGIVTELEGQLAAARAELAEARTFMKRNSPRVRTLAGRVKALDDQVTIERARLANDEGLGLTNIIFGYEPLALDQKLAQQQYTSTLASLEAARAEAQRKQRYLIAFVQPSVPDEAVKPERVWNTLLVFVGSLMAFGIGALVWSAIKEHARL